MSSFVAKPKELKGERCSQVVKWKNPETRKKWLITHATPITQEINDS